MLTDTEFNQVVQFLFRLGKAAGKGQYLGIATEHRPGGPRVTCAFCPDRIDAGKLFVTWNRETVEIKMQDIHSCSRKGLKPGHTLSLSEDKQSKLLQWQKEAREELEKQRHPKREARRGNRPTHNKFGKKQ